MYMYIGLITGTGGVVWEWVGGKEGWGKRESFLLQ
jgi:hypothetical protein